MKSYFNINSPLFTNNSRKMAGLPLKRKTNGKKRKFTRCEAVETISALIDWWNL